MAYIFWGVGQGENFHLAFRDSRIKSDIAYTGEPS